jgi:pimeloyl-ACP methyl ester carboxylesterase
LYAYIGVSQIIDAEKSIPFTYRWLHKELIKSNDNKNLKQIEVDQFPFADLVVKYGGYHNVSLNLTSLMQASPYYFEGYLDLLRRGQAFSQDWVAKNPKAFYSPMSISKVDVPVYFFEGVNDRAIGYAPELVVEYLKKLKAPIKEIVWFKNSAHMINIEEPDNFQEELIRILKENKID